MNGPKTRILFVIENECFGGGERAFAQLINGLDKSRYEVYAACLAGEEEPAAAAFVSEIAGAARVLNLDLRRLASPSAFFSLKTMIRENQIRVVHSQGARADFYARLAARSAGGVSVVSTIASPVEEYNVGGLRKAVYGALDRFSGRAVDRFVAVADHIERKLLLGRGIPRARIVRIYNGIDAAQYLPRPEAAAKARADYKIRADAFLVAAVSRLSREKGLFTLLEAAKIIAAGGGAGSGVRYIIAGEGPLESELKAKAGSLGVQDKFVFAGFLGDVRPLLGAADVFVLPSIREGFPLSVLEAMAAGRPVIASDIDGVRESVTEGLSGLLVPPGDGAALARAITGLFNDRARAAGLGRGGRGIAVEKFGLDRMVKEHEGLYGGLSR